MTDIAFIGAGKMAEALVEGIISSEIFPPHGIVASDIDGGRLAEVEKKYGISAARDNASAVSGAKCVLFAVKPSDMERALVDVKNSGRPDILYVSIVAGMRISSIKSVLGEDRKVFRVMPNLPVVAGEGASAACGEGDERDLKIVRKVFGAVGMVEFVSEDLMDAFTALSGSGPGFAAAFAESLICAGEELGIPPRIAERFAVQTLFGSAKMMAQGKVSPKTLREAVSSPAGTTVAGLCALEESGFQKAVKKALTAARERSKELSATERKKEKK